MQVKLSSFQYEPQVAQKYLWENSVFLIQRRLKLLGYRESVYFYPSVQQKYENFLILTLVIICLKSIFPSEQYIEGMDVREQSCLFYMLLCN